MPHRETEPGAKGVVQLLAASANANFADKIAKALLRAGYKLDPGSFDPDRIDAVVVLWTGVALDKPSLIDAARQAWNARRLTPVSIGRVEPPFGSREVTPMDLAGWRGDDEDPRWRFVLSDIEALQARARLEQPEEPLAAAPMQADRPAEPTPEPASKPAPDPLDNLFTDEETTPHHPARALWRKRLLPAAPMAAGVFGALAFAAGVSFMAGSLSSRPDPIDTVAENAPPLKEQEEPTPQAKLALVRLAPGAPPPEKAEEEARELQEQPASAALPGDDEVAATQQSELPVDNAEGESVPQTAQTQSSSDGEYDEADEEGVELEETPQQFAALAAPSLKPAPDRPEGSSGDSDVPLAEDLNQAALAELASAVEAAARTDAPEEDDAREDYLGDYFTDCEGCPDMAALGGGVFLMGARPGEQDRQPEETPQRRVEIGYRFAIATRETTFDQWALCVAEGGCRDYRPGDAGWGRGDRPVINVSYEDAAAFARWLSAKTGHYYRLPSEAEWEYAARAGTGGPFHFGDALSAQAANFNGNYPYRAAEATFRGQTVPVTQFAHNAFGLFDMHGNVAEWTLDCWNASHNGGPATGAARIDGDCARRVVKGGSWNAPGWRLRSAARRGIDAERRSPDTGFRVVRTLP
ncbi:SUMF1/EgtB/PvdO family nonheme iron enzyme [Hyphococcus sp.]|uniref:SUMF1/EgtB/PvdO family nonheme iron enzyme n=1 Tax=Hyphococcus sp. TaxID=2038636 RepID=UPI0035C6EA42